MGHRVADDLPDPFLVDRCRLSTSSPPAYGYCVSYEDGEWRKKQFAAHLMEWLPDFVLTRKELSSITSGNMLQRLREAARSVYTTQKYQKRGEFGELILHAILRQFFDTSAIVKKLYFKDSANNTVKGFDAVHVSKDDGSLRLWLGEAKFYKDLADGVRDALNSVEGHIDRDVLRQEFTVILRQVDDEHDWVEELRDLLHQNRSLDDVFPRITVPIMVTYDSVTVAGHTALCPDYESDFVDEVTEAQELLAARGLQDKIDLVGLFVPLASKGQLVEELDSRLKSIQGI